MFICDVCRHQSKLKHKNWFITYFHNDTWDANCFKANANARCERALKLKFYPMGEAHRYTHTITLPYWVTYTRNINA